MRPIPLLTRPGLIAHAIATRPLAVAAVMLLVALTIRLPTLGQPLLEHHAFRQTQTAYPALIYHEAGVDLSRTPLPVLGPPFDVPFELPLFQALSSLVMASGLAPDAAVRTTSLAAYLVTALLTWALVRRVAGAIAAHLALAAFLFSPLGLLTSRWSTIEYLATAGALGGVLLALEWMETRHPLYWLLAVLAATVGMLVKVTTGLYWLLPVIGYRLDRARDDPLRGRSFLPLATLLALPVIAAAAWTGYADAVKARAPQTMSQTSAALVEWNYGSLEQRLDPGQWASLATRIVDIVVGPFVALVVVAVIVGTRSRLRWYWTGVALACALPVVTFFNLYVVHDYYLAAVSPGLCALVGLGGAVMWERLPHARGRLLGLASLSLAVTVLATTWYWGPMYDPLADPEALMPQARELAALSRKDDLVLVLGRDWNPAVLYYARRRGLTLADRFVTRAIDEGWMDDGYTVASVARPQVDPLALLRHWRVIAPVGPRTYHMRGSPSDLADAPVIALTDDAGVPESALPVLEGPRELQCGRDAFTVPQPSGGVWLRFAGTSDAARLWITAAPAALPLVPAVFIDERALRAGPATLTCSGTSTVTLLGVSEGPPPR